MRPLAVETVNGHFVQKVKKGFIFDQKPLNTSRVRIDTKRKLVAPMRLESNQRQNMIAALPMADNACSAY